MEKYYLNNNLKPLPNEIWKETSYNSNYMISNYGRVMRIHKCKRSIILKQKQKNYLCVNLGCNGKTKTILVHRLVALAFIDNPLDKPMVNHIDGNKYNNCVSNLEWCTRQENAIHSVKVLGNIPPISSRILINQFGVNNLRAKPVLQIKDGNILAEYECIHDAALEIGVSHSGISRCCNGKQKLSKGFEWKYKEKRE